MLESSSRLARGAALATPGEAAGVPVDAPSRDATVVPLRRRRAARAAALRARAGRRLGEAGMTTAEYAVGTVASCGLATILLKILTSGEFVKLLADVFRKALGSVF